MPEQGPKGPVPKPPIPEDPALVSLQKPDKDPDQPRNLADFLGKIQLSTDRVPDMIEKLKSGEVVNFRNFSTEGREQFVQALPAALQDISEQTRAIDGLITVKCVIGGDWKTIQKQLTPEEFEAWMTGKFKAIPGKFMVDYADRKHYKLSDGDQEQDVPAFVFDAFQVIICPPNKRYGGNFSKYYYAGSDPVIAKTLLEEFQIPPPPPWDSETLQRLLVPCALYAITRHEMTDRQRRILTAYLESRMLTRYIPMAYLAYLAEEFDCQIEVVTPDEKPIAKYASCGVRYTNALADGSYHRVDRENRQEGRLFGTKQPETMSKKFKLVLWNDHFYAFNPEHRHLLEEVQQDLKPLNILQANVFGTLLPRPVFNEPPVWNRTFFKTPKQMLDTLLLGTRRGSGAPESVKQSTLQHLEDFGPKVALKLFLDELIKLGLDDVLADSGTIKYFLRQSIRGATFELPKPIRVTDGVVMLDRNSNHAFALSQIALPRGYPRKGIPPPGCIGCVVTDRGIFNTLDLPQGAVPKAGFYWEHSTEPGVLKPLMEQLYAMRSSNPNVKGILNCMYGKLIEKPPKTEKVGGSLDTVRTSPLIKQFSDTDTARVYEYYCPLDYTYNYTMIASLLLAQQRKNMREVESLCKQEGIPIYYKAADSIAVPESALPKLQHLIGPELGQFKVEALAKEAIFVKPGLYFVGEHIRPAKLTQQQIREQFESLVSTSEL